MYVALDERVLRIEHAHAVAGELGGVAFLQEDHPAGGADDRGDVGGDEVLALAKADQQRAAHPRGNHGGRVALVDHRQRVGAFQFLDRLLQRAHQAVALRAVVVDQVGDDFGVGLRGEFVTERLQALPLRLVVLDDAVVDQRQLVVADVRMRIELGDAAVGGPAGVADAEAGVQAVGGCSGLHFGDAAGAAHAAHRIARDHGDPGGIVAAVFQALEAVDQQRDHVTVGDGADDSAHACSSMEASAPVYRRSPRPRRRCPTATPSASCVGAAIHPACSAGRAPPSASRPARPW